MGVQLGASSYMEQAKNSAGMGSVLGSSAMNADTSQYNRTGWASMLNAEPTSRIKVAEILEGEYVMQEPKHLPAPEWKLEDELSKIEPGKS